MNTNEPQDDLSTDGLDAHRNIIRQSLGAIINEIGMAVHDVGLTFPAPVRTFLWYELLMYNTLSS